MASRAGIRTPRTELMSVAGRNVLLLNRFDRVGDRRIGYVSAMTMLEAVDGEHRSYLEIAEVIEQSSSAATRDLRELWRRIAFSILISNTDDHLRNHGFLRSNQTGAALNSIRKLATRHPIDVNVPRYSTSTHRRGREHPSPNDSLTGSPGNLTTLPLGAALRCSKVMLHCAAARRAVRHNAYRRLPRLTWLVRTVRGRRHGPHETVSPQGPTSGVVQKGASVESRLNGGCNAQFTEVFGIDGVFTSSCSLAIPPAIGPADSIDNWSEDYEQKQNQVRCPCGPRHQCSIRDGRPRGVRISRCICRDAIHGCR
ncbi:HipA domain-containing protein [Cryobacterium sp. TMT2-18-3]|uniref:HipA domain-containing protein n=1 Tax=Cryobacterium sp. TMT2-18-3 TaxID=1259250 RepID=UPI0021023C12|nr:HipA domain-containing protein [Cryobacterium sp. TMT2-18-3]